MSSKRDPNRPKVPELAPLIDAIYQRPGGSGGCCLHVITDDGNWECAEFALKWAREQGHADCIAAAEMMAQMTESQISRATRKAREADHCSACGMYWTVCGHNSRKGLNAAGKG